MKKIISVLLAVSLIVSCSYSAFAINFNAYNKFEAEDATLAASQGEVSTIENPDLSGGKGVTLKAVNGEEWLKNDFVRFNAPVYQTGYYKITAAVKKGPDCGNVQLWFSDTNMRVGGVQNLYSPTETTEVVEFVSEVVCNVGESRWFEFRIDGKDSKSSGYNFTIDYFELTFVKEYEAINMKLPYYGESEPEVNTSGYEIGQVREGGTGRSTHVLFHPKDPSVLYLGLDMGGLYRWEDSTQSWTPVTDCFTIQQSQGYTNGIDGVALDENNPDVVYVCFGTSPNKGVAYLGHVYKSTDRGDTWQDTGFSGYFNANGNYRHTREAIAVDPVNSNIVMCSTVDGKLVKSTDGFKTWQDVKLPFAPTSYKLFPRSIAFDKTSANNGACQTIYLGAVGEQSDIGLYVSNNGGESFELTDWPLNGQGVYPNYIDVADDGTVVVSSSKGIYVKKNGTWSEVSPIPGGSYMTCEVYDTDSNYMITALGGPVGSYGQYTYYTLDGGKNWRLINDDVIRQTQIPRVEFNGFFASATDFAMDPSNKGRVLCAGWQNVQKTEDIFAEKPVWTYELYGIEHGCTRELLSLPTGARLITSTYDYGGGRFTDPTQYMPYMLPPKNANPASTAYCYSNPNIILRLGKKAAWYSTDNGINFKNITSPDDSNDVFSSAVSSGINPETGNVVFYASFGSSAPVASYDLGNTWVSMKVANSTMSSKWGCSAALAADPTDPAGLYYIAGNVLYYSNDFGKTFTDLAKFKSALHVRTMNGPKPYVVVMDDGQLYISKNKGLLFSKIDTDAYDSISWFDFGKEKSPEDPNTIVVIGIKDDNYKVMFSDDLGKTWKDIYDDKDAGNHHINNLYKCGGDMQQYGIFYMSGSGRGTFYATPAGQNIFHNIRNDEIKVFVNGQTVMFDVSPKLINDRTMVPMRKIFEDVGAEVDWDNDTETVTATRTVTDSWGTKTTVVKLTIGEKTMYIDGQPYEMDVAPTVIDDRTLVPLRFISQALGAKVDWIDESQIAKITI